MPGKFAKDSFANLAYLEVVESAANTLTFAKLQVATNLVSEKAALIINRAETIIIGPGLLTGANDACYYGLTVSDRITDLLGLDQPEILFSGKMERIDAGTAANALIYHQPFHQDFSHLPGGGILVPADRIYVGVQGYSVASPFTVKMRLFYTVMAIDTNSYWDLIEARRIMTT